MDEDNKIEGEEVTKEDGEEVVIEETKEEFVEEPIEDIQQLNATVEVDKNVINPDLVELDILANSLDEDTDKVVEEEKEEEWKYPEQEFNN